MKRVVRLVCCCKSFLAQYARLLDLQHCILDLDARRVSLGQCTSWLAQQRDRVQALQLHGWQFIPVERSPGKPYCGLWSNDDSRQLATLAALAEQARLTALSCQVTVPMVHALVNLGDIGGFAGLQQLTILAPAHSLPGTGSTQSLPSSFSQLAALTRLVLNHTGLLGFAPRCLPRRLAVLHCCQWPQPPAVWGLGLPDGTEPVCFAMVAAAALQATRLQELVLADHCERELACPQEHHLLGVLQGNRALSRLTSLTSLTAHGLFLTCTVPPELAALTGLQHLALECVRPLFAEGDPGEEADWLLELEQLTYLRLSGQVVDMRSASLDAFEDSPGLNIPIGATQLRQLELQMNLVASNRKAVRSMAQLELLGVPDPVGTDHALSDELQVQLRQVLQAAASLPRLRHLKLGPGISTALKGVAGWEACRELLQGLGEKVVLELGIADDGKAEALLGRLITWTAM
ncbi:hypothetical protein N2152v2_006201 [Parachlorella kessleri]